MAIHIFLIRSAPYDYLIPGLNLYESFNVVAKGESEVEINAAQLKHYKELLDTTIKAEIVFSSPRVRCIQTAQLLTPQPVVVEELREVRYQMENFISEAEFFNTDGTTNVDLARKAFVCALLADRLEESFANVIKRIELLIEKVAELPDENIAMVSHGFFIKFFEAYVREPTIKYEPKKLLTYFDGSKETFHFGEGVEFEVKKNRFKVKRNMYHAA